MSQAVERVFHADHPASRGHFAGNPIIPGAVLLNEALAAIAPLAGLPRAPLLVSSAKFLRPARPGDRVLIEFSGAAPDDVRLTCTVSGQTVLTAQVSCRNPLEAR